MFLITISTGKLLKEFKCDILDHDCTGDIRLYIYKDLINPNTEDVELVYNCEAHVEEPVEIKWVE